MKPFFSIVIPTLNEEKTLPNLLNDLENQTFKDFEVIIIDGNSEDKTTRKAEQFRNAFPLDLIISQKRHVSYQRNLGAKRAKADWIIFMDADNRLRQHFLQGIKYRIEVSNPDILTTWIRPDTKHKKDQAIATLVNLFVEIQKTTKNPYVLEAMLCFNAKAFHSLKGFDDTLPWGEGSELLRRAVVKRLHFEVTRDPKYTYSLRRLRKQGTLKSTRSVAQIELARLRNKRLPKEKATYLYPMEGGKYFEELPETRTRRVKKIVLRLYRGSPLSKAKPQKNIFLRLFNGIAGKKSQP